MKTRQTSALSPSFPPLRFLVFLLHLHGYRPTSHLNLVNGMFHSCLLLILCRLVKAVIVSSFPVSCSTCAVPSGGPPSVIESSVQPFASSMPRPQAVIQMVILSFSPVSYSVCTVPSGGRPTENPYLRKFQKSVFSQGGQLLPTLCITTGTLSHCLIHLSILLSLCCAYVGTRCPSNGRHSMVFQVKASALSSLYGVNSTRPPRTIFSCLVVEPKGCHSHDGYKGEALALLIHRNPYTQTPSTAFILTQTLHTASTHTTFTHTIHVHKHFSTISTRSVHTQHPYTQTSIHTASTSTTGPHTS